MGKLTGKKAIVTGASRGIGLAIATELAREGADVAILSTSVKEDLAAKLSSELGVQVKSYACNVADSETVQSVFKQIIADMGTVDILVNNAGITRDGLLMRMKDEDFDAVIATNLRSVFLCTRAVARTMMGNRSGHIVNVSSINALRGQAGQSNYAAAKAGVIGLTRTNAMELSSRGITVNAVAPGFIDTDMTAKLSPEVREKYAAQIPLGRLGQPEDVAKLVAFLASDDAKYITGQIIGVDGGLNA
ncbi:MAG: 3-oxoacyl-[Fibrobacter sp.]|jgi:3-oxoacyl-[acyl-carrier protein] reductase|uniref:3-oxoacyl-[acyl-carrier-protein] reductase n=1 Tax=Fibrobacter sp. TaxID=35828 RepID=UPI0013D0C85A|nr:3-oxoacyl-[acyl-carrier-protein] reductase [Fibrobacter sp.]MBR2075311.1 3-oxoacyl-[acyl-carrier-protein] reductase [Fibrobacter sp.]MBR2468913.1 3-oxoacyl-[acyl-carrier-protein] reductase [Fibrobacter sp.]MBR3852553.1 3-oxoacyl-[acyl-carrier-protein] reductase [Fibrobacter sp.]